MAFNSIWFVFFFLVFYAAYRLLSRWHKLQNVYLLAASAVFYFSWAPVLPVALFASMLVVFVAARAMGKTSSEKSRSALLIATLVFNIGLLLFFKQSGFFSHGFWRLFDAAGLHFETSPLKSVLPIAGVSFFTFQLMGYAIDVYQGRIEPCNDLLSFALFASFFPQLIAGPIGRAGDLIPQYQRPRRYDAGQINAALFLILWGYFQKTLLADNLSRITNAVFQGELVSSVNVIIGSVAYMFQLYCDFAGYSNIARGLSKLMGIELTMNFALPYFAMNPTDFWNRWHISLSRWFRDYLYSPMAVLGARVHPIFSYAGVFVTMILIGLWHGTTWPFVLFGFYHALLIVGHRAFAKKCPPLGAVGNWAVMFFFIFWGMVIFRAQSLSELGQVISHVSFARTGATFSLAAALLAMLTPLLAIELWQLRAKDLLVVAKSPVPVRIFLYSGMLAGIFVLAYRAHRDFVYFQF